MTEYIVIFETNSTAVAGVTCLASVRMLKIKSRNEMINLSYMFTWLN